MLGMVYEVSTHCRGTLVRAERNQELWAFPDALRLKCELLLVQPIKTLVRRSEKCESNPITHTTIAAKNIFG